MSGLLVDLLIIKLIKAMSSHSRPHSFCQISVFLFFYMYRMFIGSSPSSFHCYKNLVLLGDNVNQDDFKSKTQSQACSIKLSPILINVGAL